MQANTEGMAMRGLGRRELVIGSAAAGAATWLGCGNGSVAQPAAAERTVAAAKASSEVASVPLIEAEQLIVRPANERGIYDHGWLKTHHTFSFARYRDPEHMGFRSLRVINEDIVQAGQGFPMHGHRDMEILTYVLDGSLEHKDSMGHGSVIRPGVVQHMSAGGGVRHSEFNPDADRSVHFMQIWIVPDTKGGEPSYAERRFPETAEAKGWRLIASPDGADDSIAIRSSTRLFATPVGAGQRLEYDNPAGRHVWLHVARGAVVVNGRTLRAGDAVRTSDAGRLALSSTESSDLLLFDLA